jgi:hypothetical protein
MRSCGIFAVEVGTIATLGQSLHWLGYPHVTI